MSATANPSVLPRTGRTRSEPDRSTVTARLFDEIATAPDEETRQRLREEVVLANRDVAEAIASRYARRGIPQDDLTQVAFEGLVKAVSRFDPTLRNDFLSYAVPTMRGEVQRHFRDQGWTVRPPRRLQDLQWRLHRATEALCQTLGREPTRNELLDELGVTPQELDEAEKAYGSFAPVSLDLPVGEDSNHSLGDLIPIEESQFDSCDARLALQPLLRGLSARDRRILDLRFCEGRTQAEIGAELGVTQMQVSRLLARILRQLRAEITVTSQVDSLTG